MSSDVLILIPARMAATRLPGKPLADIAGEPMIVHVLRRAQEADVGPVVVATDSRRDRRCGEGRGRPRGDDAQRPCDRLGPHLRGARQGRPGAAAPASSSTCRATCRRCSGADIRAALAPLADPAVDIATLAAGDHRRGRARPIRTSSRRSARRSAPGRLRALYFTRATAPSGDGPLYHHIGLYAYRRAALARFVALPPSPLEQRERLEQLRALEAGMRIDVALVEACRFGVDTPKTWRRRARCLLGAVDRSGTQT